MAFEVLLKVLESAFGYLGAKETNKPAEWAHERQEEVRSLRREYYLEKSKPEYDMAVLGDIEHRLFLLSDAFNTAAIRGPAPSA